MRHTIDVDISDFDADEIIHAADQILAGRGSETCTEIQARLFMDVAGAIAGGQFTEALLRLERLAGDDRVLREAIDLGRRRGR